MSADRSAPAATATRRPAVTTCHCAVANTGAGPDAAIVALIGAPNSGKSTLFNALTGARTTVGNWPGTTVEVARGAWQSRTLIDLPGAYSLDPLSPDEELTRDLLVSDPDDRPDLVIVVADAANLARSLYLVSEVREQPQRVIVALTMLDVAKRQGIAIDTEALADVLGCPVVGLDPRRRSGLGGLTDAVDAALRTGEPKARKHRCCGDALQKADERFGWVSAAVEAGVTDAGEDRVSFSDRVDRIATAPVLGPLLFLGVMWVVFQVTTTVAAPMQDFFDSLFSGPLTDAALAGFAAVGLEGSWIEGLVVDGLIAGVGMVLTFVPLMALMFVLLALLEDSGYLARAAVVTDRLMRAIGLPGKAFLPLVVGFGCNVPAISATRILSDGRQRLLTALLVPFTSCTARLTVFVLLGTVFFGQWAGTVVFAMYVASILLVVGVGLVLRRTLWRAMGAEPLVIDLPPYQVPTLRLTATVAWTRLAGFLRTASGIIVITVCAVWLLQSVPAHGNAGFGEVEVEDSVYGVAAQAITPAFAPAGFAQWQTTSALVVGFVAKEAVISSWAQTYALEEPEEGGDPGSLGERIMADFTQSSNGHPIPAALAFMVFLMAYTPCVATLAAQWREIGGRWTLFGIAMQLAVAWGLAVLIFQVGSLWW
ncbi:MAG: ferrous iron transport protein B [Micropruina sp.]|uniref:ferrous iron transport protein B n=1 Tax=Micropruina sp. TaxID=2737536 RepID=UPI0039E483C0